LVLCNYIKKPSQAQNFLDISVSGTSLKVPKKAEKSEKNGNFHLWNWPKSPKSLLKALVAPQN